VVSYAQALTRDGFDLTRNAFSFLSLGDLGWIQITIFVVCGLLFVVAVRHPAGAAFRTGRHLGAVAAACESSVRCAHGDLVPPSGCSQDDGPTGDPRRGRLRRERSRPVAGAQAIVRGLTHP
jgi:hypothetical protein